MANHLAPDRRRLANKLTLILAVALLLVQASISDSAAPPDGPRPNFVIFLADDLGYADVGYHGCQDIPTPHIDSIARRGIQFTNGYSNGHVCSPTRAALLTGRYQNRFGCDYHIAPYRRTPDAPLGLPTEAKTIAERLKPLGYTTGMMGKWHLGGELQENRSLMPPSRGFDEFFGILEGAALYFDPGNKERKYRRGYRPIDHEQDDDPNYYTDAIGREAVQFIDRHQDRPFLLYVPFTAPHAPRQAKPEHLQRFSHVEPLRRRELVSMVYSLDENVGRVLAALQKKGLEEETLVCFFSDNGGKPNDNGSLNHPLRGEKTQFFEGGIRVPFCMQWPGTIVADQRFDAPIIGMDLFPTLYQLAGGEIKPEWNIDGVDLMSHILGSQTDRPHDTLYWKSGTDFAVRDGDWKLIRHQERTYLFSLADDLSEQNNLYEQYPNKAAAMLEKWTQWDQKNVPPNYGWALKETGIYVERAPR